MTSTGARPTPRWARKRIALPALALALFIGTLLGSSSEPADDAKPAAARPGPTVTATVTSSPEPAPTVTETETVEVTVTETVTEQPANGGGGGDTIADDSSNGGSVYYRNCAAARAAGAAPVHRGDPGYASHLDRDGDGIGCE
ncbi:excalibur calcium-binding domain-containing protein [Streptomyces olivaceus]|uniref:excalibur calcium-binding domain-containing protein n=1 Tax=Streptomyces olivaceus TaxID=47716 RepID=UPI001CCB01A6|nr:excalibur calcium-binding domain-containing protein [Streptomyces olivaceus]MBZ6207571.1 excalibur calcium-binding domain-containing protein [Streptomyces olivaceus]